MSKLLKNKEFFIISILWLFFSCNITKYVGENEYLLEQVKVKVDNKNISTKQINNIIREKPNTKFPGIGRLNLHLYSMSGKDEKKKINKFFRRIGEEPVLYNPSLKKNSVELIDRWLKYKGYYNSHINHKVIFEAKRAYITYTINTNNPFIIRKVNRKKSDLPNTVSASQLKNQLEDTGIIRKNYIINSKNTLLKKGEILETEILQKERTNLTQTIRNEGYYDFSEKNIQYFVDTFQLTNSEADIYFDVKYNKNNLNENIPFKKHKIREVYVYVDVSRQTAVNFDTIFYSNVRFIVKKDVAFNKNSFVKSNFIFPKKYFSLEDIKNTYNRLLRLKQFKNVRITFDKIDIQNSFYGYVDAYIFLTKHKKQSYSVEIEGNYNSGNYGVLGNVIYQNRNLLGGAEIFNVELTGGYERVVTSSFNNFAAKQFGFSADLSMPFFLFPLKKQNKLIHMYNPYSNFFFTYQLHRRPKYKRSIFNLSFSYKWETNNIKHIFSPIDFSYIKVINLDYTFFNNLQNQYLQFSLQDHIISSTAYSFILNERKNKINKSYTYLRLNIETAGNMFNLLDNITNAERKDIISQGKIIGKGYKYFDIPYAQFIRGDIDFSYYQYLDSKNVFVYHLFFGIGYPYNNSEIMPFDKLYFAGGANSMRAWQPRSLGPGSSNIFNKDDNISYADMKLEANFEYRFPLFKRLEGAFFMDVGNIWTISDQYEDDNAKFKFNRFYKELGIGTGLGVRLNLDVIVLRVDGGTRVFDPFLPENHRFVPNSEKWNLKDVVINFDLAYPF